MHLRPALAAVRTAACLLAISLLAVPAALVGLAAPSAAADAPPDVELEVVNLDGGTCLVVAGDMISAPVRSGDCSSRPAWRRTWVFVPLPNGYFHVRAQHTGMCLNVGYASQANGEQVVQYPCGPAASPHLNEQWSVVDVGGPTFQVVARHSDKCLDRAGTTVVQWECDRSVPTASRKPWQRWELRPVPAVVPPDGPSTVVNLWDWGCLGVPGSTVSAPVDAAARCDQTAPPGRMWRFVPLPNGDYQVEVQHTRMCLNVGGGTHTEGAAIVQHPCGTTSNPHPNEQWSLRGSRDGTQLVARHSGKCLGRSGTTVVQRSCDNLDVQQHWLLLEPPSPPSPVPPVEGVSYKVVNRQDGRCLDVLAAGSVAAAPVGVSICLPASPSTNQEWRVVRLPDGFARVEVQHTGMCLHVIGASAANGAPIVQLPCGTSTAPHGQWALRKVDGPHHQLVARHSGMCLDKAGATVVQWDCDRTVPQSVGKWWQQWRFQAVS